MLLETLYIVRHAPAEDDQPEFPGDDSQRRLTVDGVALARDAFLGLKARGVRPDAIWTSPFVRTRQTAEVLQKLVAPEAPLRSFMELAPAGNIDAAIASIVRAQVRRLAVVGHAPGVAVLVSRLCGDGRMRLFFERAGAAEIYMGGTPERPRCDLVWLAPAEFIAPSGVARGAAPG